MKLLSYFLTVVFAVVLLAGCGGKKGPTVAENEAAKKAKEEREKADEEARERSAKMAKEFANRPKQKFDKRGNPLPSVADPGGGSGGEAAENDGSFGHINGNNNSTGEEALGSNFTGEGTLVNGLFPQPGAGEFDKAFNLTGVGGGLFPQRGYTAYEEDTRDMDEGESEVSTAKMKKSGYGEIYDVAVDAFENGDSNKGFKALYAHVLANDNSLQDFPMKWYPGISRPRVALRWGVGIELVVPEDLEGRFPVIGDEVEESDSGSGRSNRGGGGVDLPAAGGGGGRNRGPSGGSSSSSDSVYAQVDTSNPNGLLLYYTGDVGDRLMQRLISRRMDGDYFGRILMDLPEVMPSSEELAEREEKQNAPPTFRRGKRDFQLPSVGGPGGNGGAANGPNNGRFGARNNAAADVDKESYLGRWSTGTNAAEPDASLIGELTPGVLCLGVGKRDSLAQRAVENNVDVLLIVKVRVLMGRKENPPNSTTTIRIVNPNKPTEELAKTSGMQNEKIDASRKKGREPVENELDKLFTQYADQELRGQDFPGGFSDFVDRRVDSIIAEPQDRLREAVEVMHYYREGLVDESKAISALDELTSGKGELLVRGVESEKVNALMGMLGGGGNRRGVR